MRSRSGARAVLPAALRWFLLAGFAGALLLLIWSALIEPRLIFEEAYEVEIPNLPPGWEGRRIALIADPQVGLWLSNTGTVRRVVARLVRMKPAVVCIAGDFIYERTDADRAPREVRRDAREHIAEIIRLLRPLSEAAIPTFAVLGNHDRNSAPLTPSRATLLQDVLERAGIRVLDDEAVRPRSTNGDLWLVGLSSERSRRAERLAAVAQVPANAARVVLLHNPNRFAELPAGVAPLGMAGHTHGGQVKFPFLLLRRILGRVHGKPRPISGWINDSGVPGNRLYVNRGIGFSRVPLRFNAPPEITLFTLRVAANAQGQPSG